MVLRSNTVGASARHGLYGLCHCDEGLGMRPEGEWELVAAYFHAEDYLFMERATCVRIARVIIMTVCMVGVYCTL